MVALRVPTRPRPQSDQHRPHRGPVGPDLSLATVEDLASRRLPGFAIGEHHDAALARAALCMAAAVRGGKVAGVIFHTDKGGEYTGDVFAGACEALGVVQSMGRVGSALDNAAAESLQLDPRMGAVVAPALRHQGPGPSRGRRVHRPLQPSASPQLSRDAGTHRLRGRPRRPCRRRGRVGVKLGLSDRPGAPQRPGVVPRVRPIGRSGQLSVGLHDFRGSSLAAWPPLDQPPGPLPDNKPGAERRSPASPICRLTASAFRILHHSSSQA